MEYGVETLTIREDESLRVAMQRIADAATRVIFVVDDGRLVGSVSDGDIRRALLGGTQMESPIGSAMQRAVHSARVSDDIIAVREQFRDGVDLLPVIDEAGRLVRIIDRPSGLHIPVAEPNLGAAESALVNECLRTNWVSSIGQFVPEFERAFEQYVGGGSAVSVANGTLGIVLALHELGIGAGDEVVVPDVTFGATANAVRQVGATPVLVDIDPRTWGMSAETVEAGLSSRTKAVMPVHLYGHPVDIGPIADLCRAGGYLLIEDAAQAIGSRIDGRHVGLAGDAGVFSFFANKTITTGEGGMVLFTDPATAVSGRRVRAHGMNPTRRYWHEEWGTNFRMTNLQAAVGVGQMQRIDELVARKRAIADRYAELLGVVTGIELPREQPWATSAYWLYTVLLPSQAVRDHAITYLAANGIESRPMFYPLSIQPAFADCIHRLPERPVSHNVAVRGLSLPSGTTLTDDGLGFVAKILADALAAA